MPSLVRCRGVVHTEWFVQYMSQGDTPGNLARVPYLGIDEYFCVTDHLIHGKKPRVNEIANSRRGLHLSYVGHIKSSRCTSHLPLGYGEGAFTHWGLQKDFTLFGSVCFQPPISEHIFYPASESDLCTIHSSSYWVIAASTDVLSSCLIGRVNRFQIKNQFSFPNWGKM